jgi:phage tail tape-measure protein
MVTMCPKCGSERVSERNIGRKAGGIAGGVAGALSGASSGAAIGSVVPVLGLRPGLLLVLCWGGLWLVQLQERLPAQPLMDSCLTDMSVAIVVIPLTRRL